MQQLVYSDAFVLLNNTVVGLTRKRIGGGGLGGGKGERGMGIYFLYGLLYTCKTVNYIVSLCV